MGYVRPALASGVPFHVVTLAGTPRNGARLSR